MRARSLREEGGLAARESEKGRPAVEDWGAGTTFMCARERERERDKLEPRDVHVLVTSNEKRIKHDIQRNRDIGRLISV
jgi:hypothetical protein